jgi:hypothetical protein
MLEIFKKRPMVILISILWGLGLATLFAGVANRRNCIVRGEEPKSIQSKIFSYPNKNNCYSYSSYLVPCNTEIYKNVKIKTI